MLGKINLNVITDLTKLPQKQASAMSVIETLGKPESGKPFTGASYKVLMYIGDQTVRGTNYWFAAEQTLTTREFDKHLVLIAVNEFEGEFEIVKSSIVKII